MESNQESNQETRTENETGNEVRIEEIDALRAADSVVADGFQSISVAGKSVTNLSINDLISLDRYKSEKRAGANPAACLRRAKIQGGSTRE